MLKQTIFLFLGFLIGIMAFIGLRFFQTSQERILHERFVMSKASEGVRMVLLRQETRGGDAWFVMFLRTTENTRIFQEHEQGKTFLAIPCNPNACLAKLNPFQGTLAVDGQVFPLEKGRVFLMGSQQVEQIETMPQLEQDLMAMIAMKGGQKGADALKSIVAQIRGALPGVEEFFVEADAEAASKKEGLEDGPVFHGPEA